jgi:hypothetical protein
MRAGSAPSRVQRIASRRLRDRVDERHFGEIERVMLNLSHARDRALKAAKELKADGAQPHLVEALERAATEMGDTYRRLMQGTYYAVLGSDDQLTLE